MQSISCLLFMKLGLISATAEVVHAATSQLTSHRNKRITLRTLPAQTFGRQVDTEYDESIAPEKREVSEVDSDGLTLGITIGTQPMTLHRFGTQKIVMTGTPLKSFGAQVQVPSTLPTEERLADGLQHWGSQGPEVSELPFEAPLTLQGPPGHQPIAMSKAMEPPLTLQSAPDQQPIAMSEAMVPGSNAEHEKRNQPSIVLSEAPLRNSWNADIIVSEKPLRHFGDGAAATNPNVNPKWHLAWEASITDTTGTLRHANLGSRSGGTQERIAAEPVDETEEEPSFERIVDFWRYAFFAVCIACLAIHTCRSQKKTRGVFTETRGRVLLRA